MADDSGIEWNSSGKTRNPQQRISASAYKEPAVSIGSTGHLYLNAAAVKLFPSGWLRPGKLDDHTFVLAPATEDEEGALRLTSPGRPSETRQVHFSTYLEKTDLLRHVSWMQKGLSTVIRLEVGTEYHKADFLKGSRVRPDDADSDKTG